MCARAPRDLGAVFPDGCPVRAARHLGRASSPGVVQRTPLHREGRGVHSRRSVAALPSGRGDQPRPCSALVVSHHLGGFLLLDRAGLLHPAADPGVHRVSARRETSFLAMLSCPSKPCSPPAATSRSPPRGFPRVVHRAVGPASPPALSRAGAFTARPCPPGLPLPGRHDGCPPRVSEEPGLQGLAPPSGPEPAPPFPETRARCSRGLGRCSAPLPSRRDPKGAGTRGGVTGTSAGTSKITRE
jgi:hypothetical protein